MFFSAMYRLSTERKTHYLGVWGEIERRGSGEICVQGQGSQERRGVKKYSKIS